MNLALVGLPWVLSVAAPEVGEDVGSHVSTDTFTTDVVFDGTRRSVALFAHSIRSPDYVLRRRHADGSFEDVELAPPATYRGFVEGWPEARVGAAFGPAGLSILVIGAPDGEAWIVDPAAGGEASAAQDPPVARRADGLEPAFTCAAQPGMLDRPVPPPGAAQASSSSAVRVAQIALDTDWEYVTEVGGELAVQAAVDEVLLQVGLVYEYTFGVSYEITALVIPASQAADPYAGLLLSCYCGPANGAPCNGTAWEALFAGWYETMHTDIERDVVHLLAGNGIAHPSSNQGCAEFASCHGGYGYSVVPANLGRVKVMVHELGHNWGACHCNQQTCAEYDPAGCGIMTSSASGALVFGPTTQAALAGIGLSPCLHDAPSSHVAPVLTSVVPAQVSILGGPVVLTGDRFDEAAYVDWDGTLIAMNEFQLLDPQTIRLSAPAGTALGTHTVAVLGPGGSSSTTFESVECATPQLSADLTWIPLTPYFPTLVRWSYCGPVDHEVRLLASRSSSTVTVNGFDVLAYPSVMGSELLATPGTASHIGTFIGFAQDTDFRVQVAAYDALGQLVGVSEILCHLLGDGCQANPCGLNDDC